MFRKNVASQFIHFQGVDASTGGIKSGVTWTVRRCIDGTFAAGGGTVTEDGTTGWYKYAMSQADTNGNNIGFNFTGTGAVPQTVNIVTTAADPTDAVRLGLTALPNAAAEAAGGLYTRGSGAGQINQNANGQVDSRTVAMANDVVTAAAIAAGAIGSSEAPNLDVAVSTRLAPTTAGRTLDVTATGEAGIDLDNTAGTLAKGTEITGFNDLDAAGVRGAVGLAAANLDTQLSVIAGYIDTEVAAILAAVDTEVGAIKAKTDNLPASPAATGDAMALTVAERAAVADKLLGRTRAGGADGGRTVAECLAFGRNKWEIAAGVLTVYSDDDTTPLYTAAVATAPGDPVTSVDPV